MNTPKQAGTSVPPKGGYTNRQESAGKWQSNYRNLLLIRQQLLHDRQELLKESSCPVGLNGSHMADIATDEFDRDLDLSLLRAEDDALFEVEEALRRIEHGTYGVCELSGRPIPQKRLRAIPWTRFTAEAELEVEGKGWTRSAQIGNLGRVEIEPETMGRALREIGAAEPERRTLNLEALAEESAGSLPDVEEELPRKRKIHHFKQRS